MLRLFLRIQLVLVFVLTVSLLSGCIKTTSVPTRFYVLNPFDYDVSLVNETKKNVSSSVEIASLRLPQYLEKPQIVTRSSKNRLELAEYHQWGGNLRKNMTRVLAQNISQLLDTPNISIAPFSPPVPPEFRVEIEVMRFERDFNGQVRFSTQWRLSSGQDRKILVTRMTDLESPVVQPLPDFEHTVLTMSALLGELSRIIGREILKHDQGGAVP
ncbi:MAG: hypothetical protein DRH26_08490 [Deltaproteobacteria bacterium]|nr:MAG: hypothetical protein DRH26_08490 [Deltaproteobacteria bacterium]